MSPEVQQSLEKTCAIATGLTLNEIVRIAEIAPKRYKVYQIPKRSGGLRTICHPSRELKALQRVFLREILADLPVHDSATAYKTGSSIRANAIRHAKSRVLLKVDFQNFFPSIKIDDWFKYAQNKFPHWTARDIYFSAYVMFWGEGGYKPASLSIGAPTSPLLSNALMYDFDSRLFQYASDQGLVYTRYADDITVSSTGYINKDAVISTIIETIEKSEIPKLKINPAKTKLVSKATLRRITGLVLTNDERISLGRDRKRLIRSMVHHALHGDYDEAQRMTLAGLLSFAADVEPSFFSTLCRVYGDVQIKALQNGFSDPAHLP